SAVALPPLLSWHEFVDAARAQETIHGDGRHGASGWCGGTWTEALALAVDGWPMALRDTDVTVGALRERAGLGVTATTLEPTWDLTGSEVDVGAYLAGVPECMVDATPRRTSTRGRVVTFVVPATYTNTTPHELVRNRGFALAALSAAIIEAGHSVEIWSGWACMLGADRYTAMARVISAGEPLDVGRLIFAVAHPLMCRRLWFAVWDAQRESVARRMCKADYGRPPYHCLPEDLPDEVTDPYVFPYLRPDDPQWTDLDAALDWCHTMFVDLGLLT
ncbi:MAG: hypothetical protein GEV28_40695, partial [Actinophytocola sp.]|uniref:DUF7192 family protein n=1 Tax=Actinophytocola sp. TaxID=1872138 RepID=UPI001323579A